jgi:hypothetical protein
MSSLVEQVGAQVRATADELPLDIITVAAERLRLATELLIWVRQASQNPMGVPELAGATEHLEQAGHALQVGQAALGDYLVAIGLGYDSAPPPDSGWRAALDEPDRDGDRAKPDAPVVAPLRRWWSERVDELADRRDDTKGGAKAGDAKGEQQRDDEAERREAARGSVDLLRRVGRHVRGGNREQLRRELRRVEAPVGLGLSAITPPVLRYLATDLLGHEPGPADLGRLTEEVRGRVRELLPRLPDDVLATALARLCRVPPDQWPKPKSQDGSAGPHPTDPAVGGAVITGVLLQRLGRDPADLDPEAIEPARSSQPRTDNTSRNDQSRTDQRRDG